MNLHRNKKRSALIFIATFIITVLILLAAVIKTRVFNSKSHKAYFSETKLFSVQNDLDYKVSVGADVRDSVWTKAIDINDEGIVDHNYQAYTVDFYVSNNTKDQVKDFSLELKFYDDTLLLSAWNGSIETHQMTENGEIVDFTMRLQDSKLNTVKALQQAGFETIAAGDSFNDLGMIRQSKAGFLFCSTEQIKAANPDIPAYETYDELLAAIKEAMK